MKSQRYANMYRENQENNKLYCLFSWVITFFIFEHGQPQNFEIASKLLSQAVSAQKMREIQNLFVEKLFENIMNLRKYISALP